MDNTSNKKIVEALRLEVFDGGKSIAQHLTDQRKIIIGRISSADFRIADVKVSRIHALLERLDDGTIRLTDLASSHGTFVGGERIVERLITPSDQIQIANLTLKISLEFQEQLVSESAATPAPTPSHNPPAPPARAPQAPRAEIQISAQGQAVSVSREPTQIRSLKDVARTRGVLEVTGPREDLEVTVYWQDAVLGIDHYRSEGEVIQIGSGTKVHYIVPSNSLPENFDFIKVGRHQVDLHLHPSMKGSVRLKDKMSTIEDLLKQNRGTVSLSGSDIAKVQIDSVNFFLMFVPEPPPLPKAKVIERDPLFWGIQISVAAAAILFLLMANLFKSPLEGQVKEFPEKYRRIIIENFKAREEAKKILGDEAHKGEANPDAIMVADKMVKGGNEGEGARERGKEGKRGHADSKYETGITNRPRTSNKRVPVVDGKVAAPRNAMLDALKNSGLGKKLSGGTRKGVEGGSQGNDPLNEALSGVGGGGIRSGRGSGGSGLQGTGTGGGGTAVGVGGLGTKGFGGGAKGNGIGSIPGKGDAAVGTESLSVIVLGSLSREEIERVVNAHRNEIQFCYQRELQKDPSLFGKISLKWTIVTGGVVQNIKKIENSTGSASLETCIRERLSTWAFPAPAGGSQAEVEWPWIFKPKGA